MRLVERHIIQKNHRFYPEIDRLCFLSKNLYNYSNYLVRQSFIFEKTYISYYDLLRTLSTQSDYQAIPAKVSQQILMILDRNWKSFLAANEVYKQNPSKFNARPRIPKYKNKITPKKSCSLYDTSYQQKTIKTRNY